MEDPKEMEIRRLEHLKAYAQMNPTNEVVDGFEFTRLDGLLQMINKTIEAVRKEQSHRNRN